MRLSKEEAEKLLNSNADKLEIEQPGPSYRDQLESFLRRTKADIRTEMQKPERDALDYRDRAIKGKDTNSLERLQYPEVKEQSPEKYLQEYRDKNQALIDTASGLTPSAIGSTRYVKELLRGAPKATSALESALQKDLVKTVVKDAVERMPENIKELTRKKDMEILKQYLKDSDAFEKVGEGAEKTVYQSPTVKDRVLKVFRKPNDEESLLMNDELKFMDAGEEARVYAALKDQKYNPNTKTYLNLGNKDYQLQDKVLVLQEHNDTYDIQKELEKALKDSGIQNDTFELGSAANLGLKGATPQLIDAGSMQAPRLAGESKKRFLKTVSRVRK